MTSSLACSEVINSSFILHALKGQKLLAQGNVHKQHALKGQKLLAQGSALGYFVCKPVAL